MPDLKILQRDSETGRLQLGLSGGLREFMGLAIDPSDPSELFADLQLMVTRVEQIIKEEQVRTSRPPSERLQSLQLVDILPNEGSLDIELVVAVVNEEQQQTQAIVVT